MQDADIIPECEWLAAIYQSRRQHEVDFYGWQSCDEIQDPESGRREDVLSHKSSQYFRSIWHICTFVSFLDQSFVSGTRRRAATSLCTAAKRCGQSWVWDGGIWHHRHQRFDVLVFGPQGTSSHLGFSFILSEDGSRSTICIPVGKNHRPFRDVATGDGFPKRLNWPRVLWLVVLPSSHFSEEGWLIDNVNPGFVTPQWVI